VSIEAYTVIAAVGFAFGWSLAWFNEKIKDWRNSR